MKKISKLITLAIIPIIFSIGIVPALPFTEAAETLRGVNLSNLDFPVVVNRVDTVSEEKTTDTTDNFIGTEVICSLTAEPPYYDCSKKWNIHLYDTEYPKTCNENIAFNLSSKACTKITRFGKEVISVDIHLGNEHGSETTDPYPNGPEFQTKLYHELQHAICDCTWHSEIPGGFL